MAIIKISELPAATSPVSPSDVVPALQGGVTKKAAIDQFGFLPAGSSAITRTIQEKLRESISVKDFGAVGDGTTNDFAAIQAANNAAATQNKALYFPAGIYGINTTAAGVALNQTTSWFANNDATIRRLDFGSTTAYFTLTQFNKTGLVLKGLTFDGQVTTASTPTTPNNDPPIGTYVAAGDSASETFWSQIYGVVLRGAQNAIVQDCTFKNFLRAGFRADNQFDGNQACKNLIVSDCYIQRTRGIYGDSFYFGGVNNVVVHGCTGYDYQRIGFVLEFGDVAIERTPSHVRFSDCYAELGHDGILPESNYGFWTEIGQDVVLTNCQVNSSGSGFLASGNFYATGQAYASNHSYVNCSAIRVYKFGRFVGGFEKQANINVTDCFGQCIASSASALAPTGNPVSAGYGNGIWLQSELSAGASNAVTYNITNMRMEMIDFGSLSPANTEWGAICIANSAAAAATAKQFVINVNGLQTAWLTAAGAVDTAARTVFETCTSGKFGDITASGLNDYGGAGDFRCRANITISNSQNLSFGYIMGAFQLLSGSSLKFDKTNVCLRKPNNAGSDGTLRVTDCDLFDYRGDIRFDPGWWIDNCIIADANPSSINRATVSVGLIENTESPKRITNCDIRRQLRFQTEGGASATEYHLQLTFSNNRWYMPFATESGLFITQGSPLFSQVMLSNNAFVNKGTGSMPATASMIECNQINTSSILFTGAGNAFDEAMVTAGGHVVQVDLTPTYNDAPQTVAVPFNTVIGALVQFEPI